MYRFWTGKLLLKVLSTARLVYLGNTNKAEVNEGCISSVIKEGSLKDCRHTLIKSDVKFLNPPQPYQIKGKFGDCVIKPENAHLGGSITVQLISSLTGLDSSQNKLLFVCSKVTKSKPAKLEISHTVKLTQRVRSIHIERECLAVFTFAKLGCFVRQICFLLFLYYSNFRGSGSWLTL